MRDEHWGMQEAAVASTVARQVLLTAREFERRFDSWLSELGLNLSRADVLECLASHGEAGCSQTALASSLKLSESNVCTLIERMRTDGWLFRLRSDVDRRRSVVVLSPQGAQALDQIEQLRRTRVRNWLQDLSAEELLQLRALLDRMLTELRRDTSLSVSGAPAASDALEALRRAS